MPQSAQPATRRSTPLGAHLALDGLVAALVFVATLTQLHHGGVAQGPASAGRLDGVGVLLVLGSVAPLMVVRRQPLMVFGAAAGFSIALTVAGYPLDMALAPGVALYHLAVDRSRLRTPLTAGVVVGLYGLLLAAAGLEGEAFPGSALLHTGLVAIGAWFAGERTRLRHEQVEEFRLRARSAEREAERERMLAVAEERTRIARDLHDSVGHSITVIAVRAGGARLRRTTDPEAAWRVLAAIEDMARETAGEMDQIVGSLRDHPEEEPDGHNPIGLASLDTLVAHSADAGLAVTVERTGTPRPLHVVEDQSAYRIVQEALTNAARHGTGQASLQLAFADEALEILIRNPAAPGASARANGGHGLPGMHERAALVGGTLDVTQANGRFEVRARLPYGAP